VRVCVCVCACVCVQRCCHVVEKHAHCPGYVSVWTAWAVGVSERSVVCVALLPSCGETRSSHWSCTRAYGTNWRTARAVGVSFLNAQPFSK